VITPAGFLPPFRYDGISYVWDAANNMAADFKGDNGAIRARGWGRIQYLREPRCGAAAEALMDKWEAWVAAVAGGVTDREEAVRRMNAEAE
jgi:hypothetical protein